MARTTFRIDAEMDHVLASLADKPGMAKAQALRRAVALLQYLQDEEAKGGQVIIRNANGEETEVVLTPNE